jgi:hypothetical protein
MGEQIARFKPGDNVTVKSKSGALAAGRFVKVVAVQAGTGAYEAEYSVEADVGRPFGVTQRDTNATNTANEQARSVELLTECVRRGAIARVQVAAEVKAGEEVFITTEGKVKKWESGKVAVGRALTTATNGNFAEVDIY